MLTSTRLARRTILEQIEQLISDKLFRFTSRLLKLSRNGHLRVAVPTLTEIYAGSYGALRRALGALQKANIIYYHIINEEFCLIDFVHWPALCINPFPASTLGENDTFSGEEVITQEGHSPIIPARENVSQNDHFSRADTPVFDTKTAENDHFSRAAAQPIPVLVGRYINTNLDPDDQGSNTYLPNTAVSQDARAYEAAAAVPLTPTLPGYPQGAVADASPLTTEPTAQAVVAGDDKARIVALLTDEEIGIHPVNAQRAAERHTFAFVMRQVASWWDNSDLGPGALFKNRLMKPSEFPPLPEMSQNFLRSDVYKRHYPLQDPDDLACCHTWQQYGNSVEHVVGLDHITTWLATIPATLQRTLAQLPVPIS